MNFNKPDSTSNPNRFFRSKTQELPGTKRRWSSTIIIILLLTSTIMVILPVSNVSAQQDGFEYFVHGETNIQKIDGDMDGYFETARIYYDVDSTTAYAEIEVVCLVYDDVTDKLVKELSETYTIFRTVETKETYFDFRTAYTGIFNFTLEVYDVRYNHQEYGGNDYPVGYISLEISPNKYDLIPDATSYDADADGYNDDVRIIVKDTLNFTISNASVYIDGDFIGKTNASGTFLRFNIPRGIHEVDVFYHGLHGNTDFKSEGTGQQYKIYADADPFDEDQDGYIDDILIVTYAYNYYTLPNAEVYIDNYYYGSTNQQGILYAYNFDRGFHNVDVYSRNFWTRTVFYAEALNKTEVHPYFAWVDANVVALDNDNLENDIDIYLDVDVPDGKTTNVTVNASLYYQNRTLAALGTINYSTTGYEIEDEHIYIHNLTSNLSYNIKCELYNEQGNLEDIWYIEMITIQIAYGIINVETYVLDLHDDNHLNDIIFWAHIKDMGYEQANIKVYQKGNNSPAYNINTTLRDGFAVLENLYYTNYTWTAYDDQNNMIDNGTFELYDRNPFRTVQIQVRLFDDDFDNFYDDFEVIAYDERDLPDLNVSVKITNFRTNKVVAQGFTNSISLNGLGRFLVEDLQEGFYSYTATILYGLFEYHIISTGWFYSYGNSTESTHNLNAFANAYEADNDGYKNDVKITVTDRNGQPVMNAIVFFDNEIQNQNRTNQNGEVIGKDFQFGWHDVNVVFSGVSPSVPPGSQAYTRFFSEGINYREYFSFVEIQVVEANNDGDWNDLNISIDADIQGVPGDVSVEITVEIEIYFSINDTQARELSVKFEITNWFFDVEFVEIYNLPYNESYYANLTLKDKNGNIEDEWSEENIILAPIKPKINIELFMNQFEGTNQTTQKFVYFYAHVLNMGMEGVNITIYFKSNKTLLYYTLTDETGYSSFYGNFENADYYYIAKNNDTGEFIEYGEFNIGGHSASISESQLDSDNDGYFDDFIYEAWEWNGTFRPRDQLQINLTVSIYDIYNNLISTGDTSEWAYFGYNFTEGDYKFIASYQTQRVTNGSFYSYGNGFVNSPPVPIIDSPKDGSEWLTNENVEFNALSSYDPDPNDELTYYWTSNISGAIGYSDWFTKKLPNGIHEITFYVDDGRGTGHNVSQSVIITVTQPVINETNEKPIANAGPNQEGVPVNSTVRLDGSGSKDNDGYITEYNWTLRKKPSGSAAQLNKTNIAKPSFYADEVGSYKFSLGVKDNKSEWSVNEDIVFFNVTKNSRPVVNISQPHDFDLYNTTDIIFFNSTGTYDPDNDTITYRWTAQHGNASPVIIGTIPIFNSSIISPSTYIFVGGRHIINLTVIDANQANASMEIEINVSNVPPVPKITNPVESEMFRKYTPIYLDGRDSEDLDNSTNELYFYWQVEKIGSIEMISFENTSYPYLQEGLDEGDYIVTLWVDDGLGTDLFGREHNVSTVVNFSVENQAPVAVAGDNIKINLGDTVTFNASDSYDPDGGRDKANFTYEWDFGDGDSDTGLVVTHNFNFFPANPEGNFTITLTVTDFNSSFNNSATDSLNVTINRFPVADAGADIEAKVDEMILLDGSNSTDPDGDRLLYKWTFDTDDPNPDYGWYSDPRHNVSYDTAGEYTVTLFVNDSMAEANITLTITIIKLNTQPVCDAGNNIKNVDIDADVAFSGEKCFDPDPDDTLEFTWDFGDGSAQVKGMNVTHAYDINGEYTVVLNITDGEAWNNDTITVTVRPEKPEIAAPIEDEEVKKTYIIYGTVSGPDIDSVKIKIGSSSWLTTNLVTNGEDEWGWTHDWDTLGMSNGEYTIQVKAITSYAESKIKTVNVTVANNILELDITSHNDGARVEGEITIEGTASGDNIERVEIKIGNKNWRDATDTSSNSDWTEWEYVWDTLEDDDDTYEIIVRLTAQNEEPITDKISLKVRNEQDVDPGEKTEDQASFMDWVMSNITLVGGFLLVLIFLLLILALVTRKKRRQRELLEKEEKIELDERARMEKELLAKEELEKERLKSITKQPVRCPKCKEYSVIEDDGERPLMIECVHCGAKGFIGEAVRKLEEPKLPKGFEEEDKLIIQCPKCDEMFTSEDETGEIVCPNCGVRGQLNEETIEELKSRREELAQKMEEERIQQKDIEEKGSPSRNKIKSIEEVKKIKCPNCDSKFEIPIDAKKIECPTCGVTGSL